MENVNNRLWLDLQDITNNRTMEHLINPYTAFAAPFGFAQPPAAAVTPADPPPAQIGKCFSVLSAILPSSFSFALK
jgi:hypothetical protein